MKLQQLLEATDHEIHNWFIKNMTNFNRDKIVIENGMFNYEGSNLYMIPSVTEIKYPIGKVKTLSIGGELGVARGKLTSLKNFPKECRSIEVNYQSITKIDQPLVAKEMINICKCNITSLKNVHKFVSCEELRAFNNPVKDSILGILLIPNLKNLEVGSRFSQIQDDDYDQYHQALEIVAKYVGQGNAGVIKAQRELIDNDLDDYAEI